MGGAERSTKKGAAVKPPLRAVPFSRRRTERRLVRQSGGLFARLDFLAEGLFNRERPGLVARAVLELNFDGRRRFSPTEFHDGRVGSGGERTGLQVIERAGGGRVHDDGVMVGLVLDERGHGGEEFVAAFLAEFPDLFDGLLLLVDLVDDGAGVLHVGQSRLFHAAGVAVVEGGDVDDVAFRLFIDLEGRVLRPRPVEVALALGALALDLLTVLVDRRQERLREVALPAFGRAEDPLDLLVAADLDDGRLMAGGNDDGVVFRVIVDGVDVQPVAARARADDVAEVVQLFSGGEFLGGERLAGLSGVDVKADGALVEDLEHVGAVDVEDVRKAPFVMLLKLLGTAVILMQLMISLVIQSVQLNQNLPILNLLQ